jgi:hypothetical protein
MKQLLDCKGVFNGKGFLQIEFAGHQPEAADSYINGGSVYLTSTVILPLGLPVNDMFWTPPLQAWTAMRAWTGGPLWPTMHGINPKGTQKRLNWNGMVIPTPEKRIVAIAIKNSRKRRSARI